MPRMSLFDFQSRFNSEEACQEHLFSIRWPNGFRCPHCGYTKYYLISERHLYQCRNCGYQASLTAGTVFHKTRTPLQKWFWAIFLASNDKRRYSALELMNDIKVSYPTAWHMLRKIRVSVFDDYRSDLFAEQIKLGDTFFLTTEKAMIRGPYIQR